MASHKAWVIFKREYLERVRSPWFAIATLLGPVFMAMITIVPLVMSSKTRVSDHLSAVIIVDAPGTDLGRRVAAALLQQSPDAPVSRVRAVTAPQVPAEEDRAT